MGQNSSSKKHPSKKDGNICQHCGCNSPVDAISCNQCAKPLVLKVKKKISIWCMGSVDKKVLQILARGLEDSFGIGVVIQPSLLNEKPSLRPEWNGISATVFLNQVHRRHQKKTFVNLGVTERNIVPDARHNFLFGYAYMGLPAAVVSLHPLSDDHPSPPKLAARLLRIAVHEIGHTLGLNHHEYDEGIDCVMIGDEEMDCLASVDQGSAKFCVKCRKLIQKHLK